MHKVSPNEEIMTMAEEAFDWGRDILADINRSGPVPLYFQVSQKLQTAIESGTIPLGSRLENEISIAEQLGISRPTIRRAIQELVDKGLLVRRRGIGTQVVQSSVIRPVELTSLYEDMQNAQLKPGTTVLTHTVVEAKASVAEALSLPPGASVLLLRRSRSTDGVPFAILKNYLPVEFADISVADLEFRGLYQNLRSRGVTIRVATQRIAARRATSEEAELLEMDRRGPLLTMKRVSFDQSGAPIEFGSHCYRPDMYSFETTLVAK